MTFLYENPGKYVFKLPRGKYLFECWGAQGGSGSDNGVVKMEGGKGAYVSGTIVLHGQKTFYGFVGGKGSNGKGTTSYVAPAGYNGGGNGGADTNDDDSSGAGGGCTDIRLEDGEWDDEISLKSRILVAAGGSGSARTANGAPGGKLKGLKRTGFGDEDIIETDEKYELGRGQDGGRHGWVPPSGAGCGYYGGVTPAAVADDSIIYKNIATSGNSYVSGYPGCEEMEIKMRNAEIFSGIENFKTPLGDQNRIGHTGNGTLKITLISTTVCNCNNFISSYYTAVFIMVLFLSNS